MRLRLFASSLLLGCVLVFYAAAMIWGSQRSSLPQLSDFGAGDITWPIPFLAFAVIGLLLVVRVRGNPIGWLFLLGSWFMTLNSAAQQYSAYALTTGSTVAGDEAGWLGLWTWIPGVGAIAFMFLLFPDGRLPSSKWRFVFWALIVTQVLLVPAILSLWPHRGPEMVTYSNPGEVAGGVLLHVVANFAVAPALVVAASSLLFRYRKAPIVQRQQLKWFSLSAVFLGVAAGMQVLVMILGIVEDPNSEPVFGLLTTMALVSVPIASGIAITRYRLYEIDRIISRTVTYALVVGLLGLIILGLVAGLAVFLPTDDPLVVAVSTLSVFALFNPLRLRVKRLVDRRFNRSRYDAERVIEAFAGSLRDRSDPEGVLGDWVGVVEEIMQPLVVGAWVRD